MLDMVRSGQRSDRIQGRLSQNVSLWHMDYFELKTIKTQKTREEFFTPSLTDESIQVENLVQEKSYDQRYYKEYELEVVRWERTVAVQVCSDSSPCSIVSACHDKHLIIKYLLFLSSCESPSFPLEPQVANPFLSSGCHRSLKCLTYPWVSQFLLGS